MKKPWQHEIEKIERHRRKDYWRMILIIAMNVPVGIYLLAFRAPNISGYYGLIFLFVAAFHAWNFRDMLRRWRRLDQEWLEMKRIVGSDLSPVEGSGPEG